MFQPKNVTIQLLDSIFFDKSCDKLVLLKLKGKTKKNKVSKYSGRNSTVAITIQLPSSSFWNFNISSLAEFKFTFNNVFYNSKLGFTWYNFWGGSRGGSGGSVEPPKLKVKTYNKRVVKKSEPTQLINNNYCS